MSRNPRCGDDWGVARPVMQHCGEFLAGQVRQPEVLGRFRQRPPDSPSSPSSPSNDPCKAAAKVRYLVLKPSWCKRPSVPCCVLKAEPHYVKYAMRVGSAASTTLN